MISTIENFLPSLRLSKNGVITSKDPPTTLKSSDHKNLEIFKEARKLS